MTTETRIVLVKFCGILSCYGWITLALSPIMVLGAEDVLDAPVSGGEHSPIFAVLFVVLLIPCVFGFFAIPASAIVALALVCLRAWRLPGQQRRAPLVILTSFLLLLFYSLIKDWV